MSATVAGSSATKGSVDASAVRRELDRIASSSVFRGSKRSQSFLQYVVSKTLEGDGNTLKERTLAIEVFGRGESDDLAEDSIVRVAAREVRKRLAQYYIDDGAHDSIRIELPPGSYVPCFHQQSSGHELTSVPERPAIGMKMATIGQAWKFAAPVARRWRVLSVLGLALLAVTGLDMWQARRSAAQPFVTFWNPLFTRPSKPVILIAHPIVYQPSNRAGQLDRDINGEGTSPAQRVIHVPEKMLDGSDYVPAMDQFVGFGDAEAALQVSSLLQEHHVKAAVRLASRVDFYDLRRAGAVLIGAYTNRWVMELTKNMRFHFGYRSGEPCLEDASRGCRWTLSKTDNGRSSEDYVLISRLPHPQTGGFVLIIAGLNTYGTEESGHIVSDADALTPMLRRLPPHWTDRNLEIVLHVSVIGDEPAQSEVVAVHTW